MAITSIGAIGVLFETLKASVLFTDLKKANGNLYRLQRPLNSEKEDVVINALAMMHEAVQEGVLNVNVYTNNLEVSLTNGETDRSQPNWTRLQELQVLAKSALGDGREIYGTDGETCFKIQQDAVFPDENNQHYLNFRIEFYSIKN